MSFLGVLFRSVLYNNSVTYWDNDNDKLMSEMACNNFEDIVESYDD